MIRGLNKVMIIGRLANDPELRYTPKGKPVATFRIATSRSWNANDGSRRTEVEWFNIVAWSSLAELCNSLLSKGKLVYIEGRLHNRKWDDQEGNKHTSTEIVANEMIMLERRSKDLDEESSFIENEGETSFVED